MRLSIQLCVSDVLFGRVRVDFRPTFVEKIVVSVGVERDGCLSIGAEEETLVRSFVDEKMFELMGSSIDWRRGSVCQTMTKNFHRSDEEFFFNPLTCDFVASTRIGQMMARAVRIVSARVKASRVRWNAVRWRRWTRNVRRRANAQR